MLDKDQVKSVKVTDSQLKVTPKNEGNPFYKTTYTVQRISGDYELVNRLIKSKIAFEQEPEDPMDTFLSILISLIPTIVIFGFLVMMMRRSSGMMGVGKSNAKVYVEKKTGVTFADVAGQGEAKETLTEMVDFLHHPERYTEIGAKLPKGALLVGPPGTGKTLLAKAVAGEAGVPFFSLSGSDFVEMFVGVGASRVRDLFKQAQQMAPCIIFIDEIDAIGKSRDNGMHGGGNDEREQTLNALLAEMDGFDTSKGIIILAATNRPEVLDKALLRPGRFDRRVIVERPDLKGRIETLKVHAKDVKMDETVDFEEMSRQEERLFHRKTYLKQWKLSLLVKRRRTEFLAMKRNTLLHTMKSDMHWLWHCKKNQNQYRRSPSYLVPWEHLDIQCSVQKKKNT